MPIAALYAGLLAALFVALSLRVIAARRAGAVALGDGGNPLLQRRIRAHGNFSEYVPFALVLLALAESLGSAAWLLHATGITLVAGRCIHAAGVSRADEDVRFRVTGMVLTFGVLGVLAAACLVGAISRW